MKNQYETLEKKYIKSSLAEFKKLGYKCRLKITELQDLIAYLTVAYVEDVVDLIDNEENAKLYFNRVKREMPEFLSEFLLGYYHARKTRIIMVNAETKEQKFAEFSYYPILINKKDGSKKQIEISYIGFEPTTGKLLKVPKELDITNVTTLEELYEQNKDSDAFDLTFIKKYLMINQMDITTRNLVIDCAARRIMGAQELDLEVRLNRASTFVKSMAYNIPNFKDDDAIMQMIEDLYQELKEKKNTDGDNGLKKKKK